MIDRIEKTWKDLDFDAVNFKDRSSGWSFSKGGLPLRDGQWAITHVDGEGKETRYCLPDAISTMLNIAEEHGKHTMQLRIRETLGLLNNDGR